MLIQSLHGVVEALPLYFANAMMKATSEEDFGHLWRTNARRRDDDDMVAHSDRGRTSSLEPFAALSTSEKCRVSSDTRGHLGPVEVTLRGGDDRMCDRHAVHNQRSAARSHQVN
jgi:hypothetical protein